MLRTLLATALALLLSVAQADDLPLPGDSAPARTVNSSSKPHARPAHSARHSSTSRHHGKRSVHAKHRRSSHSAKAARHHRGKAIRHHGKVTTRHASKTVKTSLRHQSGQHAAKLATHARKKSTSKKSALHASKTRKTPHSQQTRPGKSLAHAGRHQTLKRHQTAAARHHRTAHHAAKTTRSLKPSGRRPALSSSRAKPGKSASAKASKRQHKQRQHTRQTRQR